MQTTKPKNEYMGRPTGSLSKSTIKKRALKLLEQAVLNDELSDELRTKAALRITEMQQ
jgi:hypothetical protein